MNMLLDIASIVFANGNIARPFYLTNNIPHLIFAANSDLARPLTLSESISIQNFIDCFRCLLGVATTQHVSQTDIPVRKIIRRNEVHLIRSKTTIFQLISAVLGISSQSFRPLAHHNRSFFGRISIFVFCLNIVLLMQSSQYRYFKFSYCALLGSSSM